MSHQLRDPRRRIEALAAPGGAFRLACARTRERPVPAADLRFPNRRAAERAAHLTDEYRHRLRRWDPQTPRYRVVVHECAPDAVDDACAPAAAATAPDRAPPGAANGSDRDPVRTRPGDAE